jgi:hypothetical protein
VTPFGITNANKEKQLSKKEAGTTLLIVLGNIIVSSWQAKLNPKAPKLVT